MMPANSHGQDSVRVITRSITLFLAALALCVLALGAAHTEAVADDSAEWTSQVPTAAQGSTSDPAPPLEPLSMSDPGLAPDPAPVSGSVIDPQAYSPSAAQGWVTGLDGNVYYYVDGRRVSGEQCIQDPQTGLADWYYFDPAADNAMVTGWMVVPASDLCPARWVYYDPWGRMLKGEQAIDGHWYYLDPFTGTPAYGFYYHPDTDKWVYYDPFSGQMQYGVRRIDGKLYYLDEYTGKRYSSEELVQRLTTFARSQVGDHSVNHQQWVADVGGNYCYEGPCMSLVTWMFHQAGLGDFLMDGYVSGWPHECYNFYASRGQLDMLPTPGSVVLFQYGGWSSNVACGHAELVVGVSGNIFYSVGALSDGIKVRARDYSYVVGFAHPQF